jgi:hypothetical protein
LIGPAVWPSADETELRQLVAYWANQGPEFVQPLEKAPDFRRTLDELKRSTELEKQVTEYLKALP